MAELTQKTEILLDRLYNLKGEDNVIINELLSQIIDTEREIGYTDEAKKANELSKINCEGKLELFLTQKQAIEETFQGLGNDTFAELSNIGVELAIGDILANISDRSPAYCEGLRTEIDNYQSSIDDAILKRGNLTATLVTLENKKSKAEAEREQLVSLLEQSLSNDEIERDSLTAHYVKKILTPFEVFSEEELAKLTKLIMFPDEGLYQYDQSYEDRLSKGLIGLTEEPVEEVEEVVEINEEPVTIEVETEETTEPVYVEETTEEAAEVEDTTEEYTEEEPVEEEKQDEVVIDSTTLNLESFHQHEEDEQEEDDLEETRIITPIIPVEEEVQEEAEEEHQDIVATPEPIIVIEESEEEPVEDEEPVIQISEEETEDNLENYLASINLDVDKFEEMNDIDVTDVYAILESVDRSVIETNYEVLRSISLEDEVYKCHKNHMYLADVDLSRKINLLRAKGINEHKIKELLEKSNSGLREDFSTLLSKVNSIENLHRNVDETNIDLINCNVVRYEENLKLLSDNGYELDEKEIRNHNYLFFESENIPSDISVLKDYLISIVKNNGKYALSVFWKNSTELMNDIDSLIEADLENIITSNPESLGVSASEIIRRVKYCEEKGEPVYEGNGHSEFCKYITNYPEFYSRYGLNVELPTLANKDEVNNLLPSIIGNEEYSKMMIELLDKTYSSGKALEVTLNESLENKFTKLRNQLEEKLGAKVVGKYTYKLNDVCISKNKFERNLAIILNALAKENQPVEYIENEIILASALYNLHQEEDVLRNLVQQCTEANN